MDWYRVNCKDHHRGTGTHHTQTLYVYANDILSALARYQGKGNTSHSGEIPNIRKLSSEEAQTLETYIVRELKLDIKKARKIGVRFRVEVPPV